MKRISKKIKQKKNKSRKVGARHEGGACSREGKIRVVSLPADNQEKSQDCVLLFRVK